MVHAASAASVLPSGNTRRTERITDIRALIAKLKVAKQTDVN